MCTMVEVQDSKDEKQENRQESTKDYAEKYIRRRGLDSSKPFTSRITRIGYSEESEKLLAKIRTPDIDFMVRIDGRGDDRENLATFLSESPRELISRDDGLKTERKFDSWLSSDLRRFGFTQDNKKYDIIIQDLPNIEQEATDLIRDAYPHYIYRKQGDSKPGVRRKIDTVTGLSNEKFKVDLDLTKGKRLEWIFPVPFQVDIDKHPLANLIENEASGDPRNLESDTHVYVVKKSDLTGRIYPIGFDTTEEWALVSEKEYQSWNPNMYANISDDPPSRGYQIQKLYVRYLLLLTIIMVTMLVSFMIQFLF